MGGSAISSDSPVHLDLVGQVAAGDADALAALYRLHGAALFRLARRLTASVEDAEDVLHDLFVGLPESIHKYDGRGSLIGWLKPVFYDYRSDTKRAFVTFAWPDYYVVDATGNVVFSHSALDAIPRQVAALLQ